MPVLAIICAVACALFAVVACSVTYSRTWRSPPGAFRGRVVNPGKTLLLKLAFGVPAVALGYLAGFLAGWWR